MNDDRKVERRYQQEIDDWLRYFTDIEKQKVTDHAESWFRTDTVDAWRHQRKYACIDPLLDVFPNSTWLTVGDGRFGKDAHYIIQKGGDAVASDISDALLKIGAERGYIRSYRQINAEQIPYDQDSFDFVLCKESYHHFPRPMLAFYEMLRVARKGVILIEPNDAPLLGSFISISKHLVRWALLRCGISSMMNWKTPDVIRRPQELWEEVGNYVYSISEREVEKVALGLGYPCCAFRGLNDHYEKGVEFEVATEDSLLFRKVKGEIARADLLCKERLARKVYGVLVAVVFKQPLSSHAVEALHTSGFNVRHLPRNPYEL